MKATRSIEPKFIPVVLTLETQEEVNSLFALFNQSDVRAAAGVPQGTYKCLEGFVDSTESDKLHLALTKLIK